jgi:hypothetical protein
MSHDTSPFTMSQMSVSIVNYEEEYIRLKKEVVLERIRNKQN